MAISAEAFFMLIVINVNTIPTFAEHLKQIPILSELIGFIQLDRGLKGASDGKGKVIWKEPIHSETIFKVKLE